jgi:hypothetical protein
MSTGQSFTARSCHRSGQSGGTVTDKRDLGGTRTYTLTWTRGSRQQNAYLALTSGILIISPSERLVTSALDNRSAGSDIRHQQGFSLL